VATYDQEQVRNVNIIAQEGHKLGASLRDIEVALMAAMQESSLRNLPGGDRDSAGLFQMRPSQGWGSYAQVTDPVYASDKFFRTLFGVPNRDAGVNNAANLGGEAQAVERSGFPFAYQKWYADAVNFATKTPIPDPNPGNTKQPTSDVPVIGPLIDWLNQTLLPLATVTNQFIVPFITHIFLPKTWARVAAFMFGVVLVLVGLFLFFTKPGDIEKITGAATSAASMAAVAA
jgi:hypothetical protein